MAFGIDDLAESALGPWGLALGLGVSAVAYMRRQHHDDGDQERHEPRAGRRALTPAARAIGASAAIVGQAVYRARTVKIRDSGHSVLLSVTRTWDDLYADARREFEERQAERGRSSGNHPERRGDITNTSTVASGLAANVAPHTATSANISHTDPVRVQSTSPNPVEKSERTDTSAFKNPVPTSRQEIELEATESPDLKRELLAPGETAPMTGRYAVTGPRGGQTGQESITVQKGTMLPPTPEADQRYELIENHHEAAADSP
ncbi:MAG: hypothetical protein ACKVVP_02820 [Chloroflexota bacterium]